MALGRRGLRRSAEPGRTSGRQGEAFRLADLGHIAPRRQRQAPGRRDHRGGGRKSFETWQRKRRRREARSSFQARHLLRRDRRRGRLQLGGQIGVNGDVGEGLRDGMRRGRRRRPQSENRIGKCGTLPVQSPDAYRPGEGQSGPEGNNFWKNPLRTIPALKRKVVECSL